MSKKDNWFQITAEAGRPGVVQIYIYGQLVDFTLNDDNVSAKQFIDQLQALGEDIHTIELHINSPGGSVFAGLSIYNTLKRHKARVEVTIDGLAASAASYVAMCGDIIRMPKNALMMVHNPSALAWGDSRVLRKAAANLDIAKTSMLTGYHDKTGLDQKELSRLLDEETWLSAVEAVEKGFADEIEEPVQMAASFDLSHFRNVPAALRSGDQSMAASAIPQGAPTTFDQAVAQHMAKRSCSRTEAIHFVVKTNPDLHAKYLAGLKENQMSQSNTDNETQALQTWKGDSKLREEYRTFGAYLAFRRAEAAGRVHIFGQ
jgi:ATP-dependent Clp protease protease subunit